MESEKVKQIQQKERKAEDRIVRILSEDIEGKMSVYAGLTKIKGISWGFSNEGMSLSIIAITAIPTKKEITVIV